LPRVDRRDFLAALFLAVLAILFYYPLIVLGRVIADLDALAFFYPHAIEYVAQLRAGQVPLWDPLEFAGVPFLANSQLGALYPPSLLYLLMTLGPAILVLGFLDRGVGRLGGPLVTLGRVPLFFYLLQWPLAHALAIVLAAARGEPPDEGHGLTVVYLLWLVALLILYPLCSRFAALKRRRRDAWLSYF